MFRTISRLFSAPSSCLLAATALSGTMIGAGPVIGQEEGNSGALEQIIVTAERKETFLQETPVAVTALSQAALENLQVDAKQDLQRVVPGLKLLEVTSNPANFEVSLRGSTQQDSSLIVAESPVGFYVDDVYIARLNGSNAQLADIERVEVLRGPQGTLYGRNTLAGAVKLVTATPDEETRIRARLGFGEYGAYEVQGAISGALGENWFGSVAALANGMDGFYTNLAINEDWGAEENTAFRAKLRFAPDNPFSATATLSQASSDNDGYVPSFVPFGTGTQFRSNDLIFGLGDAFNVNIAPNASLPPPNEPLPRGETDQTIASLDLAYDFDGFTARSITAHVQTDDYFAVEFTGVGGFAGANRSETSQFSQEFQLLGSAMQDRLDWLVGVYLFDESADQVVALVTDDALAVDTTSYSVFANGSYALSDKLNLTLGARWTRDEKEFEGTIRQFVTLVPIAPAVRLSNDFEAFTPKFSLDYQFDPFGVVDDMMVYASAGRGFKSGGFNGIAFGNLDVLRTAYDPETNWTYEIGVKTDMFNNSLRLNAAAFLNDISDVAMTAQATGPGGVSFPVQNAGDAEVRGLELEATLLPADGLTLFANVTLQDGEYTSLRPGSSAANAEALFGEAFLPQIADIAYTIGGTYEFASPFQKMGSVLLGIDHFYTDDYYVGVGNDMIIDGFGRSNAFVAYRFNDNIEARLGVTNIDDGIDISTGAPVFSAVAVEPPRQAMFTLSYRN